MVEAFLAASRAGDFAGLVAVLDPEITFRIDPGKDSPLARPPIVGAENVAREVLARGRPFAPFGRTAIVNGAIGLVVGRAERPFAVAHHHRRPDRRARSDHRPREAGVGERAAVGRPAKRAG